MSFEASVITHISRNYIFGGIMKKEKIKKISKKDLKKIKGGKSVTYKNKDKEKQKGC